MKNQVVDVQSSQGICKHRLSIKVKSLGSNVRMEDVGRFQRFVYSHGLNKRKDTSTLMRQLKESQIN